MPRSTLHKPSRLIVCLVVLVGLTLTVGSFALGQLRDDPGPGDEPRPGKGRQGFRPIASAVAGETGVSRIVVRTGPRSAAGHFLLRKNGRPVLELVGKLPQRDASGDYVIELGIIPTQEGDALELLGPNAPGGAVTLSASALSAAEAQKDHTAELRARHALVFKDDFNDFSATAEDHGGLWATSLRRGARIHNSSPDTVYSDATFSAAMAASPSMNPYALQGGVLTIKGGEIPKNALPRVLASLGDRAPADRTGPNALRYYSGSINSHPSWSQTYGYFEMRAKLPRGQGFWPAFWLTASVGWPPEIDILEAVYNAKTGAGVNTVHSGVHYRPLDTAGNPNGPRVSFAANTLVSPKDDMYDAFHLYAAEWTSDWISFFFDGRLIYRAPTPRQVNSPMIMVANLQIGTRQPQPRWAQDLADARDLSNTMQIDFISAYRSTSAYPAVAVDGQGRVNAPSTGVVSAVGYLLIGDDRANVIRTGPGLDVVRSGGGADRIDVYSRNDSHKIVEDFDPVGGDRLVLHGFRFEKPGDVIAASRQVGSDVWIMSGAQPIAPQTIVLKGMSLSRLTEDVVVLEGEAPSSRRVRGTNRN